MLYARVVADAEERERGCRGDRRGGLPPMRCTTPISALVLLRCAALVVRAGQWALCESFDSVNAPTRLMVQVGIGWTT